MLQVYSQNAGYRGQRLVLTSSLWLASLPLELLQQETMSFPVEPLTQHFRPQRSGQNESIKQSDF